MKPLFADGGRDLRHAQRRDREFTLPQRVRLHGQRRAQIVRQGRRGRGANLQRRRRVEFPFLRERDQIAEVSCAARSAKGAGQACAYASASVAGGASLCAQVNVN